MTNKRLYALSLLHKKVFQARCFVPKMVKNGYKSFFAYSSL